MIKCRVCGEREVVASYQGKCRECGRAYLCEWRRANPEKARSYRQKWYYGRRLEKEGE